MKLLKMWTCKEGFCASLEVDGSKIYIILDEKTLKFRKFKFKGNKDFEKEVGEFLKIDKNIYKLLKKKMEEIEIYRSCSDMNTHGFKKDWWV
ncbi:MAG: hypothetical protein ACRCZO_19160 [Cetobacterium sp.]